jgi:hypothetical protein
MRRVEVGCVRPAGEYLTSRWFGGDPDISIGSEIAVAAIISGRAESVDAEWSHGSPVVRVRNVMQLFWL